MTREEAISADIFHLQALQAGAKCSVWRRNGNTKLWKRDPERFQIPIKYGLRGYSYITNLNLYHFHLPNECPNKVSNEF